MSVERAVDELGRVVLPVEIRRELGIYECKDKLKIYVEDGRIIIEKAVPTCRFYGSVYHLAEVVKDKYLCKECDLTAGVNGFIHGQQIK